MRLLTCVVLGLFFVAVNVPMASAQDKCSAEKAAMDKARNDKSDAWKAWDAAFKKWDQAGETMKACREAVNKADTALINAMDVRDKAVTKMLECTLKYGDSPKCASVERAMAEAAKRYKKAKAASDAAWEKYWKAEDDMHAAWQKQRELFKKARAADDAFEKAQELYNQCLRGKKQLFV